ncbi:MAG: hydantoinase/oxoprolinase family protein [Gammaproteobacteria bacterium]
MTGSDAAYCVGVDVGGTFTDAVLTDGARTWRAKSPTTQGDVGRGVLAAVGLAAARAGLDLPALVPRLARFGLGTTAVTNVLASRTGLKLGLLTTRGFEQAVPLARGARVVDEDGWMAPPPELLPGSAIAGIDERVDRDGRVLRPLPEAEVIAAADRLVQQGVQAIAVSFLWSFVYPAHEARALELITARHPHVAVVSGAALLPTIREYERTTLALLNAYTTGAFRGVEWLDAELARLGMRVPLLLVHSAGGSITIGEARRFPIGLAASGPAAGVAASVAVARRSGCADVITCDMGGTSFDVSVITAGEPARRTRGEVMGVWTALSQVDVESIGAGGGSLGWIDARGMPRVGPGSAGAQPGPACYRRGGTQATVTDALVVLGYIDPGRFLGGEMALDARAAHAACARMGEPLGLDAAGMAWGIREIALAGMVKAVRSRLGERGLDARSYALLSYGGSGSLFTGDIALATGACRVLVPELASVLSAFGAATTDVRRERMRAVLAPADAATVNALMVALREAVLADLAADGIAPEGRRVEFEADIRFTRQIWEIPVALPDAGVDGAALERVFAEFRAEYAKRYGQGSIVLGAPMELVGLRAIGIGRTVQAALTAGAREAVPAGTPAPPVGQRAVRLRREPGGEVAVAVYDGPALRTGHALAGPALIDGVDTTIWIPPGMSATLDANATLIMSPPAAGKEQA